MGGGAVPRAPHRRQRGRAEPGADEERDDVARRCGDGSSRIAQAAFIKPKAIPWGRPLRSAPSAIKANAGVKRTPYAPDATIRSGT
jgi:hypothetical protein